MKIFKHYGLRESKSFKALCKMAQGPFSYQDDNDDVDLRQFTAIPIDPVIGPKVWITKWVGCVSYDVSLRAFTFQYMSFVR